MSYSPFNTATTYVSGPASTYPWSEGFQSYPDGSLIGDSLSRDDASRHFSVTCGAARAVLKSGQYVRASIEPTDPQGAFRAVARPRDTAGVPVKWTNAGCQYRFYYLAPGGGDRTYDPGFKAFARYQSEDDLYVASWRFTGLVLIQRKLAGVYTRLASVQMAAPSTGVFHTLAFDAVGSNLTLSLDGVGVLTCVDTALTWGTIGIRTDSTPGALLDDWKAR